jgi:hypothetical protein
MEKSVESGGSTAAVKTTSKMDHFEASVLSSLRDVYDHLHEKGLSGDQTHLETADFSAFLAAMADASSNIMLPAPPSSLDRPLSAYFISASHNTYLTGHQLYGSATVDGYKTVRLRRLVCDCLWSEDGLPGDQVTPGAGIQLTTSGSASRLSLRRNRLLGWRRRIRQPAREGISRSGRQGQRATARRAAR